MKQNPKWHLCVGLSSTYGFFSTRVSATDLGTTCCSFSALRPGGLQLQRPQRRPGTGRPGTLFPERQPEGRNWPRPAPQGRHQEQGVPLNTGCPLTHAHRGPPLSLATVGSPWLSWSVRKAEGKKHCQGSRNKGGPECRPHPPPCLPSHPLFLNWEEDKPP